MIQTDSYFFIGKTHEVCQDYAANTYSSAVVCDGCSGSPNTDFGSRILSRLILDSGLTFNKDGDKDSVAHFDLIYLINKANIIAENLSLKNDCLDSTILYLQDNEDTVEVLMIGDGTLAVLKNDGNINTIDISFPSGAPRYLNYYNNEVRSKQYTEQFTNTKLVQNFDLPCKNFNCVRTEDWFYTTTIEKKDNKAILLMSDGVHSFLKPTTTLSGKMMESVSYVEVLKEILDFKGFGGRFIQRRMHWFQNKIMPKLGWQNDDDISMCGMYFKE